MVMVEISRFYRITLCAVVALVADLGPTVVVASALTSLLAALNLGRSAGRPSPCRLR